MDLHSVFPLNVPDYLLLPNPKSNIISCWCPWSDAFLQALSLKNVVVSIFPFSVILSIPDGAATQPLKVTIIPKCKLQL